MPVNKFLERFGFRADPFESTNAETEPWLADYFIPPPYFSTVLGDPEHPSSHVVLAPRGSGKTAQRRMIEEESVRSGTFLCVTYDYFEQPPGFRVEQADLPYHLNQICRLVLLGVLLRLEEQPYLVDNLTSFQKGILKYQVGRFLGSLSAQDYEQAVKSVKSLGDRLADVWRKYGGPIAAGVQLLLKKAGLDGAVVPKELLSEKTQDESLGYHFAHLVSIAQSLWLGSVYILVDRPTKPN